ncbi:MAG: hypothetical protein Tsb0020_21010 [Haliangiales bacterium]
MMSTAWVPSVPGRRAITLCKVAPGNGLPQLSRTTGTDWTSTLSPSVCAVRIKYSRVAVLCGEPTGRGADAMISRWGRARAAENSAAGAALGTTSGGAKRSEAITDKAVSATNSAAGAIFAAGVRGCEGVVKRSSTWA